MEVKATEGSETNLLFLSYYCLLLRVTRFLSGITLLELRTLCTSRMLLWKVNRYATSVTNSL